LHTKKLRTCSKSHKGKKVKREDPGKDQRRRTLRWGFDPPKSWGKFSCQKKWCETLSQWTLQPPQLITSTFSYNAYSTTE
jgi:hypothetical protein